LKLLREFNVSKVPCVIVNLDDAHARLFAQALNHIHGDDDLGLRAELIREVLKTIPEQEVLAILPDTMVGLKGMATFWEGNNGRLFTKLGKSSCGQTKKSSL